jgi:hypothetical protein
VVTFSLQQVSSAKICSSFESIFDKRRLTMTHTTPGTMNMLMWMSCSSSGSGNINKTYLKSVYAWEKEKNDVGVPWLTHHLHMIFISGQTWNSLQK